MKTKSIIGIAVLAVFLLSGCQYLKKRVEKTERKEYKLNSEGKIRLEVDNTNGNVEIVGSEDTTGLVHVIAEIKGRVRYNETDKPIEGINVIVDTSGEVIRIDTDYDMSLSIFGNKNKASVNYIIKVPAAFKTLVNITNGSISASKLGGNSRFESVNGSIYINSCYGSTDVQTVNGKINANLDSTKGFVAETVNGSITIGNLKNINANIEASCVNGKVKSENLNFSTLNSEKRSLSGVLGNGSSIIRLSTVNGSIKLYGNYVNMKKKDKLDWDFKFEFDDNDEPVKIKIEYDDEDEPKGVGIKPVDSVKALDTIKEK